MDQEYHNFYAGVASMLLNPIQTLESIGQQKMDTYDKEGLSYAITEIGTEVLSEILLAKGLGQLSKLSKVLNVTEDVADYAKMVDELVEGGTSTLNDWGNKIPELSKQAPIEIPSSATVKIQIKNGYEQISFRWAENGQNYEVRWHTKTPSAPEGQGNTWVVSRVTLGTPTGQVRTEHILVGDTWIPRYQWQDAINAYRNGIATQEQLQLLKDGHWQAP